jgi:hypothetical protein
MCDASGCDDLRLIKVRNGNTIIDEPSYTYQWVIDDFNTKTKVNLIQNSSISFQSFPFLLVML